MVMDILAMKTRDGEPLGYKPPEASAVFGGAMPQPQYQVPMQQQQYAVDPITGAPIMQ